jgi:flagellar basal body-associated protein FliL
MIKLIVAGVWACLVTLAAFYGTMTWKVAHSVPSAGKEAVVLETQKTRTISVPIVADGTVQGYVVAQFSYVIDSKALKQAPVPPEVFLLDEAFRTIYSDDKFDFKHLDKYDITKLTKDLVQRVNTRLNADLMKDVLVEEFNFFTKEDAQKTD